MDNRYCPLPERVSKNFFDLENDIIIDLQENNPEYQELIRQLTQLKNQHRFISELWDGRERMAISEEQHETLREFISLYMQANSMEREHIYFRGHTDGFAYLQKIGALKEK